MASRFVSNLLVSLYATFLLVACFAFKPAAVGWLGFAMACATVPTVLVAQPLGWSPTSCSPNGHSAR